MNREDEIKSRMRRLLEHAPEPGNMQLVPPPSVIKKKRRKAAVRLAVVSLALFLIATTGVLAYTGWSLWIPGVTSSEEITYSIERTLVFEQGNSGHRILYGYMKDSTVYLKILFYDPAVGLTDNQPADGAPFPHGIPEYALYYNGTAQKSRHASYSNTSADLQYTLPRVPTDQAIVLELYADGRKIGDIPMVPVSQSMEFVRERPHATIDGVTLTADVTREGDVVDIYISAVLPNPVDPYDMVEERLNGFAESDVYLVDAAGNIVADLGGRFYETSDKAHLEDAILLFYHHARFAAEELTGTDYTLVIPSVTYLEKKTGLFHTETTPVEIQGPFEIPIRLP